jgi:hypothetical protein
MTTSPHAMEREKTERKVTAILVSFNGVIDALMAPLWTFRFSIGSYHPVMGLNDSAGRRCIKKQ